MIFLFEDALDIISVLLAGQEFPENRNFSPSNWQLAMEEDNVFPAPLESYCQTWGYLKAGSKSLPRDFRFSQGRTYHYHPPFHYLLVTW